MFGYFRAALLFAFVVVLLTFTGVLAYFAARVGVLLGVERGFLPAAALALMNGLGTICIWGIVLNAATKHGRRRY